MSPLEAFEKIQIQISKLPLDEFLLSPESTQNQRSQKIEALISDIRSHLNTEDQARLDNELNHWGPLAILINDSSVTEIIVNGPDFIWFEQNGKLQILEDRFYSAHSFRNFIDRLTHEAQAHLSHEFPSSSGTVGDFRLSLIGSQLTKGDVHFSLRRHPKNPWSFDQLQNVGWCNSAHRKFFDQLISTRSNFLVIGPTGCGKTSVLNSFLGLLPDHERVIAIEDTSEIALPNSASMKLLTRFDAQGILPEIDQAQLVKNSLRLRPDRLVMGEVRGSEAKDFLMTLATGHSGSMGTLHAQDSAQALIRLEMLIQMGAPQWGLSAIRKLIQLSLQYVLVSGKDADGKRIFKGAHRICSLEENGFLLEPVEF